VRFVAPEGATLVEALPSGAVFQVARVKHRGADAVCKRLLPRMRAEHAARAAMVREATALSLARHASLPTLLGVGADAHGPFVLEAFVDGASFRRITELWRDAGEPAPPRLVAHLAVAAARALAEVHELSGVAGPASPLLLVHGDLGPDHLVMTPAGGVAFVDLGAARFAGMDPGLSTDDRGTLPFAAPEVLRGEAPPDQLADVYALAATILFLAAGGAPLVPVRDAAAMLLAVGERGLPPELCDRATGLSADGRDALRRAIRVERDARPPTARALWAALSR
jgi:serine/threonine protein kinase